MLGRGTTQMTLKFTDLNVASLDYTDIVTSMTNFLKQEPTLSEIDFDNKASAANMLVNILATATAYNGVYAQFGYKESFLSTATLLSSIVGLASNSSILLEVKKSAQTTRNITVGTTALAAYTGFSAVSTNGEYITFYNITSVPANTIGATVTLYSGSSVVEYTDWDYTSNSIVLPLTVDPETINLNVVSSSGTEVVWTKVNKNDISSSSTGNYYTVLNTVNGYLVTANLPNSNSIPTSSTVYCTALISNGSLGNNATISANTYASFLTDDAPTGGYDELSVDLARAIVQFSATSQKKCVTISDIENAILASGISGTSNIDDITVANADEPCVVKVYVNGLSTTLADSLITYLSDRSVAGINLIYSQ
jgi:hypothetical protein